MGISEATTILAEGERWVVQEVAELAERAEIGIAEEPEDPYAPAASKLHPITFTSHQTGEVRHGMLRKPMSRATYIELENAFKRAG